MTTFELNLQSERYQTGTNYSTWEGLGTNTGVKEKKWSKRGVTSHLKHLRIINIMKLMQEAELEMTLLIYVTFTNCGKTGLLNLPDCLQAFIRSSLTDINEELSRT